MNLRAKYLFIIILVAQGFLTTRMASSLLAAKELAKSIPASVPGPGNSRAASQVDAISLDDGIKSGNAVRLLDKGLFEYQMTEAGKGVEAIRTEDWIKQAEKPFKYNPGLRDFWFRFSLSNKTYDVENFIFYHGSDLVIERMELYLDAEGFPILVGSFSSGEDWKSNSANTRISAFNINVPAQKNGSYMLHVKTAHPFLANFEIAEQSQWYLELQNDNFTIGIGIGFAVIIVLVTAMFAYITRDGAFAWFAGMAMTMILDTLIQFGFRNSIGFLSIFGLSSKRILLVARPLEILLLARMTQAFVKAEFDKKKVLNHLLTFSMAVFAGVSLARLLDAGRNIPVGLFEIDDVILILVCIAYTFLGLRGDKKSMRPLLAAQILILASFACSFVVLIYESAFAQLMFNVAPMFDLAAMGAVLFLLVSNVRGLNRAKIEAEFEAGKNEGLKTLLRVVSHDISNSLAVAQAYAYKGASRMAKEGNAEAEGFDAPQKSGQRNLYYAAFATLSSSNFVGLTFPRAV